MRLLPFEYAVRNLGRSRRRLIASVVGSALVVLLVLVAGAFAGGMERSLTVTGRSGNVILLGTGSEESIERSQIDANVPGIVTASIPGLRQQGGVPYVSPQVHMMMAVKLGRDDPQDRLAVLRGVTPTAFLVHPQVQVVNGRAPRAGAYELMVGDLAATRLGVSAAELAVGRSLWFDNHAWTITGQFRAPGTVMAAEVWIPLSDLQIATKRDSLSGVIVTLDRADFGDVDAFCKQRLDLELAAVPEERYYAQLLDFFGPIRAMVWATAVLIALGGLFGGLNTMYAAFASRVRELATLQTLGYARTAIVVSLVQESVLATAGGALVAAAAAVSLLDGVAVRFSMGVVGLAMTPSVVAGGLLAGLALGVIGALPPAWRCLRLPIADALKTA